MGTVGLPMITLLGDVRLSGEGSAALADPEDPNFRPLRKKGRSGGSSNELCFSPSGLGDPTFAIFWQDIYPNASLPTP